MAHNFGQEVEFEDNWVKAYGLIFETYCSRDMQVAVRELIDYETRTIDNPLELLTDVEKLMHVPRKAVYPTLALLETISSLLTLRQQEKEGLMSYLERFKSERNVVLGLFGKKLLDGHVENMPTYTDLDTAIADDAARARAQQKMKDETLSKFFALMFLKQSDQNKYGHLMKEFRQSYANKQWDLYPENLPSMFDVMQTVEIKKVKAKSPLHIRKRTKIRSSRELRALLRPGLRRRTRIKGVLPAEKKVVMRTSVRFAKTLPKKIGTRTQALSTIRLMPPITRKLRQLRQQKLRQKLRQQKL